MSTLDAYGARGIDRRAPVVPALGNVSIGKPTYRHALLCFLIGAWLLDVQLPSVGVNVGNLLLVSGALVASAMAVLARVMMKARGVVLQAQDYVYLAYLAFALLSATWSPAPVATVVQIVYLVAIWLAVVNLSDANVEAVLKPLLWLAFITALTSILLVPLAPSAAFQPATSTDLPELRGIFAHQLRLGLFMATALGLLVIGAANRDLRTLLGGPVARLLLSVTLLACLIAAFARLYTAAMLLALVLTFGLSKPGWRRVALSLLCCGAVAALWLGREQVLTGLTDLGADLTLTGRTMMWVRTVSVTGWEHWLGFGYASFDHPKFDWLWGYYRPAHPHNSYLQAYFETGYIGLALTVAFVVTQLRAALGVSRTTGKFSYSLFLVLLAVIGSFTGSNYAGKPSILFCITYLVLSIEARPAVGRRLPARADIR